MRGSGRTYVPLAMRLADFGARDDGGGGAARAMGRLLREGAQGHQEPARTPLINALLGQQAGKTEGSALSDLSPPAEPSSPEPVSEETAAPDLEARLAAAREEGFAAGVQEGMARVRAEAEARIAALEKAHVEELATREHLWADRLAAELAERLQEGFRHLAHQLEEAVAYILAPIVQEAMREQALTDLAATIAALVEEGVRINVKGPSSLIEALKSRLPACQFEAKPDEKMADIKVHMADAIVETRLGEWQARLIEAMATSASAAWLQGGSADSSAKTDGEKAS